MPRTLEDRNHITTVNMSRQPKSSRRLALYSMAMHQPRVGRGIVPPRKTEHGIFDPEGKAGTSFPYYRKRAARRNKNQQTPPAALCVADTPRLGAVGFRSRSPKHNKPPRRLKIRPNSLSITWRGAPQDRASRAAPSPNSSRPDPFPKLFPLTDSAKPSPARFRCTAGRGIAGTKSLILSSYRLASMRVLLLREQQHPHGVTSSRPGTGAV